MEDVHVCPKCGSTHVHQDENVLDTWFSSQLWTFATQGWPQKPELLEGHHPTTALVTARDIIALWVARMIMSLLYFLDEVPSHDVIYPTIPAGDGSRTSKSKGNGASHGPHRHVRRRRHALQPALPCAPPTRTSSSMPTSIRRPSSWWIARVPTKLAPL